MNFSHSGDDHQMVSVSDSSEELKVSMEDEAPVAPAGLDDVPAGILALPDGPAIDTLSISPVDETMTAISEHDSPPTLKGVVGLSNIGNTCFMNSVLQCLLHCQPLCEHFVSGAYENDINRTNVLGTGGKLVTEFANLVNKFWTDVSDRAVAPRELKSVIGHHAPMFMGYSQQDAQEFLTFFLDGLHEDLNLVLTKPYTEVVEGGDGRPDGEVAALAWERHLLRNKSKIVDLFQGQFKSRLRCPHCGKSSVTFDPFMYLSLPIPSVADLSILVTFSHPSKSLPPIRLAVNVFRDTTDLGRAIAAAVVSELPDEYSEDVVIDDVAVYTLSSVYHYYQRMGPGDTGNLISGGSNRVSARKIFCTYSPSVKPEECGDEPSPKRVRSDSRQICVQTRICPKSKYPASPSGLIPTQHMSVVGAPCTVTVESGENGVGVSDLIGSIKRAVLYSVGPRSREILEGLKHASVFATENGPSIIGDPFKLSSTTVSSEVIDRLSESAPPPLSIVVDIPVEEDEEESWADRLFTIDQCVWDYYRTEKSWKLNAVGVSSSSSASKTARVNVKDCFSLFSAEEVLSETDQWYCSSCKTHVQASKKIELWKMPLVLVIHLKRFQYTRGFRNKIESVIEFPIDDFLDVTEFLPEGAEKQKYSLFGISNHMGSLYSGHYTAYAKVGEPWYSFNDSYVSPLGGSPGCDSSNYLLFYQRSELV
jgi:ubiquitin C-terminal hydrolase